MRPFIAHTRAVSLVACLAAATAVIAGQTGGSVESAAPAAFAVSLRVDAGRTAGELAPVWRFFGYDEPNYTYLRDGRKLLSELAALGPAPVYVRAHNLLTSGDGTPAFKWGSTGVYAEDAAGHPDYRWDILDRIFDAYHHRGLRPYVEIGFMPKALSVDPSPYRHHWSPGGHNPLFTGWAYPPKDYAKWGDLVYAWARHCVERYGRAEVRRWYWEVWNEPNIPYWRGTPEEYFKLYDFAVAGVRRALPDARVGGPEIAGTKSPGALRFLRRFFDHCLRGTNYATGRRGAPLDFISFHAKGAPRFVNGHVRMGLASQLRDIDRGFATVADFPALRDKPIVIGESDPDGCAACPATLYPQNGYRNTPLYASYTAEALAGAYELAARHRVHLAGFLTWAFEFEGQPYFAGFRALASNGIDLPILNLFRMLGRLGTRRLAVTSTAAAGLDAVLRAGVRGSPAVEALATRQGRRLCVLVWHYADDDAPGPAAAVELAVRDLPDGPQRVRLHHYRIDDTHSDAYTVWQRMGSPPRPTPRQYARLEQAGRLALLNGPQTLRAAGGRLSLEFALPREAVSLLVFEW
jgi:xylan 1,4-beta-xylosidase